MVNLQVRNNKLASLPQELFAVCNRLQNIDLAFNKLTQIDASIGNLSELRDLKLNGNGLVTIPSTISECVSLQTLDLSENRLQWLPDTIEGLRGLVQLNLSKNALKEIPRMNYMKGMNFLDLSWNGLEVNIDLTGMLSLTFVDVSHNRLTSMPRVPLTEALARIYVGNNVISAFDVNLPPGLTELRLNDNKMRTIPPDITNCRSLRLLDVSNNDINDLPASVGYMESLQRCGLEGNPIRSIRRTLLSGSVEELKKYLRTRGGPPQSTLSEQRNADVSMVEARLRDVNGGRLDLSGLHLTSSPPELHQRNAALAHVFESITGVNLSSNALEGFPHELGFLPKLQELDLTQNSLSKVDPLSYNSMPAALRMLCLRDNNLSHVQVDALVGEQIRGLYSLLVGDNRLEELPECVMVGRYLCELELAGNMLTSLCLSDLDLPSLEVVRAENNRISQLDALSGAPRLRTLLLDNNDIREVPTELALLPLTNLTLFGNPLVNLRQHQITSTDKVLDVLKGRLRKPPEAPPTSVRMQPPLHRVHQSFEQKSESGYNEGSSGATMARTQPTHAPSVPTRASVPAPVPDPAKMQDVFDRPQNDTRVLAEEVARLECIVDEAGQTSTELRLAKKELAIKRANLMRLTKRR